jgi:hypothetical protein
MKRLAYILVTRDHKTNGEGQAIGGLDQISSNPPGICVLHTD